MMKFKGIMPALVTPPDENERINATFPMTRYSAEEKGRIVEDIKRAGR